MIISLVSANERSTEVHTHQDTYSDTDYSQFDRLNVVPE
jgi:hypothetical protein